MLSPCAGCPFKDMTHADKLEAVETGCNDMLCHESECLDGDGPDRLCAGFYAPLTTDHGPVTHTCPPPAPT